MHCESRGNCVCFVACIDTVLHWSDAHLKPFYLLQCPQLLDLATINDPVAEVLSIRYFLSPFIQTTKYSYVQNIA